MNLKLAFAKIVIRANRKKAVWKHPVGQRYAVVRDGNKKVDVLLYAPKSAPKPWPVLFNIHGGAWVGCDASQMDSYCVAMAEKCGAFIVNINYTKLDIEPFPYPQTEICDTILYFRQNASQYGLDTSKFAVIGYSAGGHLAAASTLMLHDMGVDLSAQVLCYAFLDFRLLDGITGKESDNAMLKSFFFPQGVRADDPYISPCAASSAQLRGIAPAVFVCCGPDPLTEGGKTYRDMLEKSGVRTTFKLYEKALHGFLEVNHQEYPPQEAKSPEQQALSRQAEDYIAQQLKNLWNEGENA